MSRSLLIPLLLIAAGCQSGPTEAEICETTFRDAARIYLLSASAAVEQQRKTQSSDQCHKDADRLKGLHEGFPGTCHNAQLERSKESLKRLWERLREISDTIALAEKKESEAPDESGDLRRKAADSLNDSASTIAELKADFQSR